MHWYDGKDYKKEWVQWKEGDKYRIGDHEEVFTVSKAMEEAQKKHGHWQITLSSHGLDKLRG